MTPATTRGAACRIVGCIASAGGRTVDPVSSTEETTMRHAARFPITLFALATLLVVALVPPASALAAVQRPVAIAVAVAAT